MNIRSNAIVGQSGGPTAAINATLAGVIHAALEAEQIGTLYGMRNGIDGFLGEQIINLSDRFAQGRDLQELITTPGAALGSCRRKLPPFEDDPELYERLFKLFSKYDIRQFFYIGGNDSMDTVDKVAAYARERNYDIRVIGIPKTIDNDLCGTDHTPGFGSAAKFVAVTIQELLRDCAVYTVPAVTVVEIMGRDAGWLTAAAGLPQLAGYGGPDLIYLPERVFDLNAFLEDIRNALAVHPNVLVAVSEGIRFADGTYVGEGGQSGAADVFGHRYLAGTGKVLEQAIRETIGCKVRSVELSLCQRCASSVASATDLSEAFSAGEAGVSLACQGKTGLMVTFIRENEPYRCSLGCIPVSEVANRIRKVPDSYIDSKGNQITVQCLQYLRPLIVGEPALVWRDGMPVHLVLD